MKRLKTELWRNFLDNSERLETNPHEILQFKLIGHFLYGQNDQQLIQFLELEGIHRRLMEKDAKYWEGLIRKFIKEGLYVAVLGVPSKKFAEEISQAEKDRIQQQVRIFSHSFFFPFFFFS
jgi:Zn-dependent M16 (insulinase) family peptidase